MYREQRKQTKIDQIIEAAAEGKSEKFVEAITMGMINVAPFCKDLSFDQEGEWRLAFYVVGGHTKEVKFRDNNGLVIPYYEFNLEENDGQLSIQSIKIGPVANAEEWEISLGILLPQHGVNAQVSRSKVPYRPKL
jgi:hypothetical protein